VRDRLELAFEDFTLEQPKTKLLAQKVKAMGLDEVLLITDEIDRNLELSSRNLVNIEILAARNTNPVSLVRYPAVVLTRKAMAKLEEMLA